MNRNNKNSKTNLIHPEKVGLPADNNPLVEPIHVSSKFSFDTYEQLESLISGERKGFLYSRVMNPTVHMLENTLARLQGVEAGICTSSGLSAISTLLFTLLGAEDHIVYFVESYKPTRYVIEKFLAKWGVNSTIVSIHDKENIKKAIETKNTKAVIFESPTNPLLHVADIKFITSLCMENDVLSILDNTFAGFHNHHDLGIDLYIHSLTKFAGGHSDTTGGVILGGAKLIDQIRWPAAEIGACLAPRVAYEIQKGLKTYDLRYSKACQNAAEIAIFLSKKREIARVVYPGLESHPQHSLASSQQIDFGTIVTIDLDKQFTVKDFINGLSLFKASPSLGCVESLVAPVDLFYGGLLSEENKKISGIRENTLRLSIGIEDVTDLKADLNKSLKAL